MIKILITGGSGFIGKSIINPLINEDYDILAPTHSELDITNSKKLQEYLIKNKLDWVIHCATKGGRRTSRDSLEVYTNNTIMFENLLKCNNLGLFKYMICFGSGFEYSKAHNIYKVKENNFKHMPKNFYAISKVLNNLWARDYNNIFNLRIFNCFGPLGMFDSFIYTAVKNYIDKKPIEIWEDKYFDSLGINDLIIIIKHILKNPPDKYLELNCVYFQKYLMSEMAEIINNLSNYRVEVIVKKEYNRWKTKNYCALGARLKKLNLPLNGLEKEIENLYKEIINGKRI